MDPFYQAPHCWVVTAFTKGSRMACKIHFNKKRTMVRPHAMRTSGKIKTKKWLGASPGGHCKSNFKAAIKAEAKLQWLKWNSANAGDEIDSLFKHLAGKGRRVRGWQLELVSLEVCISVTVTPVTQKGKPIGRERFNRWDSWIIHDGHRT